MSYKIEFERRAIHQLKKLDFQIRRKAMKRIRTLREDPYRYSFLSGVFSGFRKIIIGTPGGEYRVVYTLSKKLKVVNIVFVGSRENFYKELQRYLG